MYTSVTGIVYIYKINIILSYSLMYSTHTTRPKIKTGNPSPNTHHQQQKITTFTSPHKLYQIYTQFTKIIRNEFETEFDRTLTYQRKINFLTILNHQFSPKITYLNLKYPLQNLTIYEVLSK